MGGCTHLPVNAAPRQLCWEPGLKDGPWLRSADHFGSNQSLQLTITTKSGENLDPAPGKPDWDQIQGSLSKPVTLGKGTGQQIPALSSGMVTWVGPSGQVRSVPLCKA